VKWRLTKQADTRGTTRGSARDKRLRLAERAAREVERRTELEGEANRWSKEVGAGSQKPINWWKPLALGTWNVRVLRPAISQEMVATDMASQRLAACALQEVAWEGEERRQVGEENMCSTAGALGDQRWFKGTIRAGGTGLLEGQLWGYT
jgi:hypothetical protein